MLRSTPPNTPCVAGRGTPAPAVTEPVGLGVGACQKFNQQGERGQGQIQQIRAFRHGSRLRRMRRSVQVTTAEMAARLPPGFRWQAKFVTLTYARVGEWEPRHIRDYLQRLRVWFARRSHTLRYVWVAELQRRGAVHYHMVVWVPHGLRIPLPDASGMWPHGSSNVQTAEHPVAYLAKYASKGTPDGENFPPGLRIHGAGGLGAEGRIARSFHMLPAWLRKFAGGVVQRVSRLPGGLFVLGDTGECVRSPWEVIAHAADWSWVDLRWRGCLESI